MFPTTNSLRKSSIFPLIFLSMVVVVLTIDINSFVELLDLISCRNLNNPLIVTIASKIITVVRSLSAGLTIKKFVINDIIAKNISIKVKGFIKDLKAFFYQ